MATKDKPKRTGLAATLTDPLNWALLILALAFAYYVMMVPYWQDYYLKQEPQVMTLEEYLANPTHPRPPMLRTLGAPPSSIEVVIEPLTVKHIDTDSITLTSEPSGANATPNGPCDTPPMIGAEQEPPLTEILVAGDNMDLFELSVGQQVSLQTFGLHETDLGLVPEEPTLESDQEERFSKDELDALELIKLRANGSEIPMPYVETGEFRLIAGLPADGEQHTLEELADDTVYIQTANALAGAPADVWGVRLIGREQQNREPYFIVEDAEGRRARVFYNQRLLSEWRWALDRLEGHCMVARGTLRTVQPADLRTLETDGNIQALMDGNALISTDGAVVISLDTPDGEMPGSGSGAPAR